MKPDDQFFDDEDLEDEAERAMSAAGDGVRPRCHRSIRRWRGGEARAPR